SPAIANGVVYVGSVDGKLYAFPASCSTPCGFLWVSQPTGASIYSSPAVANGVVYVGSNDRKLYAFPTSCSSPCVPLWVGVTGNSVYSSPAVVDGVVYAGSEDDRLYAFDLASPPQAPVRPDPRTLVPDDALSPWSSFPQR